MRERERERGGGRERKKKNELWDGSHTSGTEIQDEAIEGSGDGSEDDPSSSRENVTIPENQGENENTVLVPCLKLLFSLFRGLNLGQ